MLKKILLIILVSFILSLPIVTTPAFSGTEGAEHLYVLGIYFYKMGRHDEALTEFKKVLMLNPAHAGAKEYIDIIFREESLPEITEGVKTKFTREDVIEDTLSKLSKEEVKQKEKKKIPHLKITGNTQLGLGMTSEDDIWKRANYDLNERNWRMLSEAAHNRRFNTYDPKIYDRVNVNLNTDNKEGFNFHSNISVDPWSFTGKSSKITITSAFGDTADVELKYWSNTRYTVNETIYSNLLGNSFNLREIKVKKRQTDAASINGNFTPHDTFNLSAQEIHREFQPIRELWFDYNQEGFSFRLFPLALQEQTFTSDDPLHITNNHIWWEDSVWLRRWRPGIYNSGLSPVDFTKGYWDNSLSFLSRDSSGIFLTGLRGLSFKIQPQEQTYFTTTLAAPKHLWQDYSDIDNLITASRFKHYLTDTFSLGSTLTTHTAFNVNEAHHVDSRNFIGGLDLGYEFTEGVKADLEVLTSRSDYDLTNSDYKTESRGNTLYLSIVGRYPAKSIMDLVYGYDDIKLEKRESFLLKTRFFISHMDEGFEPVLSSFRNTRNDTFWSRHITFRKPFDYYQAGLSYPTLKWDDIYVTRIGTGIDTGRDVWGFRLEAMHEDKFSNLFDLRNVHDVDGKYIENVTRDELMMKLNDKLTAKLLAIYHDLPDTKGGIDPFIYNKQTGKFLPDRSDDPIDDGGDPSLTTASLGLEYAFSDRLSLHGIWERTNDYSLAYADFPRSVFDSYEQLDTYYENGMKYRREERYLYDQQIFPQPPYKFYNIFKVGLRTEPIDNLDIYLDYTRNEFAIAGANTSNMNHVGLEMTYMFTRKFGMAFFYTYSRWKDPTLLDIGNTKTIGHHNVFTEFRYQRTEDDEFILQYGEGNRSPIGYITFDPFGGSLLNMDTQHLFRFYYRRKF